MNAQLEPDTAYPLKTRIWDSVEYLCDEEDIHGYIEAALEEAPDDIAFLAVALGDIARARTVIELSRKTGIDRDALYKMTRGGGEGRATAQDVAKLAQALDIDLSAFPAPHAWAQPDAMYA